MEKIKTTVLIIGFLLVGNVFTFAQEGGKTEQSASFSGLFSNVSGDEQRFRQTLQVPEPFYGGLESFSLKKELKGTKIEMDGRALYERDFGLNVNLLKDEVCSVKIKLDTYRHYYDSSDIYYPYYPFIYELDRDLGTDRSFYGIETNLTFPDLPKFLFGYERKEREGDENLYWGGWVRDGASDNWIIWTNPLAREIDYGSNLIYAGMEQAIGSFNFSVRQEWEQFSGNQEHVEPGYRIDGRQVFNRFYKNMFDNTTWTTKVNLTGDIVEEKLNLAMGYDFQTTKNENNYDANTHTPTGAIYYDEHSFNFNDNDHDGKATLHSFRTKVSWYTTKDITVFGGIKYRRGKADNDSRREEEGSGARARDNNTATDEEVWNFDTVNKEETFTESIGTTFSYIPKTKVTLGLDFEQSEVDYNWRGTIWTASVPGESISGQGDWAWEAATKYKRNIFSLGVRSRPFNYLSGHAKYKYKINETDVNESVDMATNKPGDPEYSTALTDLYYPGRIEDWRRPTHEFNLSLDVKPFSFATLRPVFDYQTTDYKVRHELQEKIAEYDKLGYGISVDAEPIEKSFVSISVFRQESETWTRAAEYTSSLRRDPFTGAANAGYFGGIIGAFNSSSLTLNGLASYEWKKFVFKTEGGQVNAKGDFDTKYWFAGIGTDYKINETFSVAGGYTHYDYSEDDNGGINDFNAEVFLVRLKARF